MVGWGAYAHTWLGGLSIPGAPADICGMPPDQNPASISRERNFRRHAIALGLIVRRFVRAKTLFGRFENVFWITFQAAREAV